MIDIFYNYYLLFFDMINVNHEFFDKIIVHDFKVFCEAVSPPVCESLMTPKELAALGEAEVMSGPNKKLEIVNFVINSIIPILGITFIFHRRMKSKNFYFSTFLSIILIVFIMFFANYLNLYWEVKEIIFYFGYLAFIFYASLLIYVKTTSFYDFMDNFTIKIVTISRFIGFPY